jgi:hypothetical protein
MEKQVQLSFMRKCLSAVEHVSSAQLGASAMKGTHMSKLMSLSTSPSEVTEMVNKMVAWSNNKNEPIPGKLRMYLVSYKCKSSKLFVLIGALATGCNFLWFLSKSILLHAKFEAGEEWSEVFHEWHC